MSSFLNIPEYILEKHKKGLISSTHLSDIIRCGLLAQYGGIWLDATILLTATLDESIREQTFWTINGEYNDTISSISYYRWNTAVMKGNNVVFGPLYKLWLQFWHEHDHIIDYLLLDYFIELIYQNDISIKGLIDAVPMNNLNVFELQKRLNSPYTEESQVKIDETTYIFKLQRRETVNRQINGEQTLYGKLYDRYVVSMQ
ncbi:hypothetical protein DXC27_03085 [Ruminococcus sp. OM08-7]|nr:hypothetical protein DXC27_03085 [Ruminococcus sp. OM08-7]